MKEDGTEIMEKLWKGRASGAVDRAADDFNASIRFDRRLWRQDIEGSVAHVTMLGKTGIVAPEESEAIAAELRRIFQEIESGTLLIDPSSEDIHTFVELQLTSRLGGIGKKLHTARSRNDQTALDLRMYLAEETGAVGGAAKDLVLALMERAEAEKSTIMPGYTHLQRAQPVTFGHYMLAYAEMLMRDLERLADARKRTLSMPLGSGALAGTTYPIDRRMTAELLGFPRVAPNSIDAVSDRDFVLETVFCLAMIMAHLSRMAEEMILWCSSEFRFLRLDDAFSTGSSIMPQKKNPDIAELVRGKTGRVYGSLMALLTVIKGLPLAYNKDLQEDKEAVFDALDTVRVCLSMTEQMFRSVSVDRERMYRAAAKGFLNATDLADYLAKKGMPFRDAYRTAGEMVACAEREEKTLEQLTLDRMREFSPLFSGDVYEAIRLETCVEKRVSEGGASPESVTKQILALKERLRNEV